MENLFGGIRIFGIIWLCWIILGCIVTILVFYGILRRKGYWKVKICMNFYCVIYVRDGES